MRLCEIEGLQIIDSHGYKCGFIKGKDMAQHLEHECLNRPFAGRVPDDSDSDEPIWHRHCQSSRSFVSDDENEVPEGKARPRITSLEDAFAKAPDMEGKIIDPSDVDPETGVAYGSTAKRCKYGCNASFPLNELGIDAYEFHQR